MNEYFERALRSRFGIKIQVPENENFRSFSARLYRAKRVNPAYADITISHRAGNQVFLIKKEAKNGNQD